MAHEDRSIVVSNIIDSSTEARCSKPRRARVVQHDNLCRATRL